MTKSIVLTAADTDAHNLYALILAALGVTQLPQRVDLGAVFFPDFVESVTFLLPTNQAGNTSHTLSLQDQNGNEILSIIVGIPYTIEGIRNSISLQAFKVQASAEGVVLNVSIVQN
jgi:hypothetical protein